MRLVHAGLVRVSELSTTRQGLLELELDPRDPRAYADAGRNRRVLREELLTDARRPDDFLAVRVDQLLEQGWVVPRGDVGLLQALAAVAPWKGWLAAGVDPHRLGEVWAPWASQPHLSRVLGAVTRVVPRLTGLHVSFGERTLECSLPLSADLLDLAPPGVRPLLACHARIHGALTFPLGRPSYFLNEVGATQAGINVPDGAYVVEAMAHTFAPP